MRRTDLAGLTFGKLGNYGRGSDVLRMTGLSVDNVSSQAQSFSGAGGILEQISSLKTILQSTQSSQLAQLSQANATTRTGQSSVASLAGVAGSFGGGAGVAGLLGGVLGLPSLLNSIFNVFGGAPAPAPLVPFSLPPSIQYAGALNSISGAVTPIDYGQNGGPRALAPAPQANTAQSGQTIQINVNAMDSQSFVDHSTDIARAVRQALINSDSLRDIIAEL